MKVALIKPDWRIRGGFEKVVDRVVSDLTLAGHEVSRLEIDVPSLPRRAFDIEVPPQTWDRAPGWFGHLALVQAFRELDVAWADLVISTQPPSYAVRHPRHLALFYHHARAFYDLEEVWIRAEMAPELLHRSASALLRKAEVADFAGVTHFLAGSERVVQRLRHFNGPAVPVSLYQAAGPSVPSAPVVRRNPDRPQYVLCVSRSEFTKRTELAVVGLDLTEVNGVLVGDGGRLPFVRALAGELAAGADPTQLTDADLWLNSGIPDRPARGDHPRIDIMGRVNQGELTELYRNALCVLAPAYDEDDGLTVVEAMSHGKPVIVCVDGGGLTALVRHGLNGFVVEPTGAAIAAAVATIAADPDRARQMGEEARRTAASRTPERASVQLHAAVEMVLAGG